MNIDVNCDDVTSDTILVREPYRDAEGRTKERENQKPYTFNHAESFEIRYAGKFFKIKPGETRRFPRFVAELFAKHLADHMLMKMEAETGRKNLVSNPIERPKMIEKIIIDTEYFEIQDENEVDKLANRVEELNEERSVDAGEVVNPLYGNMKETEDTNVDDILKQVKDDETVSGASGETKYSRPDLMKQCAELGIKFDIKDNAETLKNKILAFQG
jgi:hypothetical protein